MAIDPNRDTGHLSFRGDALKPTRAYRLDGARILEPGGTP